MAMAPAAEGEEAVRDDLQDVDDPLEVRRYLGDDDDWGPPAGADYARDAPGDDGAVALESDVDEHDRSYCEHLL